MFKFKVKNKYLILQNPHDVQIAQIFNKAMVFMVDLLPLIHACELAIYLHQRPSSHGNTK